VGGFAYTLVDMGVERFEQVGTWVEEGNLQELPKNEKVKKFLEWKPVRFLADRLDRMDLSELQQSVEKLGDGAGTLPGDPDANAPPAGDLDANAPPMAAVGDLCHIDKLQEIALWAVSAVVNALHEQLLPLLANVGSLLFNFIIILFVMFYFLREGENVVKFLMRVSPLPDAYERRLFERARTIVSSAVVGTGLTSLAQGVLGMIAFAVVGIPWFFYGVLMMMTSLVPLIGTALVWLPCVVYLLIIGATGKAIGLAIWCAVVVGSADNFLRPFFMKGDTGLSSGLLFFAIIGGVQVFGLMGVVYGPLIFGSCAILLHVYQLEMDREEQLASACEVAPQVLPEGTPDP
jgi:predicted PurR-regulated permease PerM